MSKADSIIKRLSDGNFVAKATSDLKLGWWLMRQRDVPIVAKLIPILAAAYVVLPVDFLPDVIPVVGQMDDIALIMLGIRAFLRMAPPAVVGRYEASIVDVVAEEKA